MNKVLNTGEHIYTHSKISNTFIFKIYFKMRSIADIYSIRHSGLSNACLKFSFAITGILHFILVWHLACLCMHLSSNMSVQMHWLMPNRGYFCGLAPKWWSYVVFVMICMIGEIVQSVAGVVW